MRRDEYLALLHNWDQFVIPHTEAAVIDTLAKLTPHLTREQLEERVYSQRPMPWHQVQAIYIPAPPILVDEVCRVFIIRAWEGKPILTIGGIIDLQATALPEQSYLKQNVTAVDAAAAIVWARQHWGLRKRPTKVTQHVIVHDKISYPVLCGGEVGEMYDRPHSVRWSGIANFWTADPYEREELSVGRRMTEPACYCGTCSYLIQPGRVCPVCRTEHGWAATTDVPGSAPCEVVGLVEKLGHKFAVDPVEARIYEYSEWIRSVLKSRPAVALAYNKLQRPIEIGTS